MMFEAHPTRCVRDLRMFDQPGMFRIQVGLISLVSLSTITAVPTAVRVTTAGNLPIRRGPGPNPQNQLPQ
jgi:hypothetical protein